MRILRTAAVVCLLVQAGRAAILNPGFENGSFPSGQPVFAGGHAAPGNVAMPNNWQFAGYDSTQLKWIESANAHGGSKYYYIKGRGSFTLGNDNCLQADIVTGLIVGHIYALSAWVASGQTTSSVAALETNVAGANKEFVIAGTPLWVDNTSTPFSIPWQRIEMQFIATSPSITIWLSSQGTLANRNVATATVFDDVTLTDNGLPSPEPATWLMFTTALAAFAALRARQLRPAQCPAQARRE